MDDSLIQKSFTSASRPAFVKATLLLPDPEQHALDPRPLAAYLLGYFSFGVRFWLANTWKFAESEAHWERLCLTIKDLRGAMTALIAEIHPNTFDELDQAIIKFESVLSTNIDPSNATMRLAGDVYRTKSVPCRDECKVLEALLDQALGSTRELRRLYDFGSCVGELQLWLWDFGPGSVFDQDDLERFHNWIEVGGSDPLPDIRPLVRSALRLPQDVVSRIPYVATLVSLTPLLEGTVRDKFLKTFLRHHIELSPIFGITEEVDHPVVALMLEYLDDAIRAWLGSSDVSIRSPLPLDEKVELSWDRVARKLRVGTKVIGSFAPQARNVMRVLDRFEEHQPRWPKQIPNFFFAERSPEKARETVKIMQKIEVIIFKQNENIIYWVWADKVKLPQKPKNSP